MSDGGVELTAEAALLAVPSTEEGVSNTVQEAMYIGLPVVVSPIGGMPEVVTDGRTGWVVPLEEPAHWAHVIRWCRDHPAAVRAVAEAASRHAETEFSQESWGARYNAIVEALAGGEPVRTAG